jgi:very-short-patch-repair endonuclease
MKEYNMSIETKKKIENCLRSFSQGSLTKNSLKLFATLGYNTDRQASLEKPAYSAFKAAYAETNNRFNEEKAFVKEWKYVDLLFQLSKDELSFDPRLFKKTVITKLPDGKEDKTIIETYLFFAIELSGNSYSRTSLSQVTREANKLFPMPVMILFKTGKNLTLSVINRRLHKKDESKDVLEKVTLIKDISIENPHRAHIEILFDLSFDELLSRFNFTNFVELHNAWQQTLDTKELNKRFYQELSNWYFWAKDKVSFPADAEKDEDKRNSISLIRLITRIVFIWFIKEKNLVPDDLFDPRRLPSILKEFNRNHKSASYYTAILQNLFFGTLNQKMEERGFAKNGTLEENRNEYGVKNMFRYSDQFSISEKDAIALFKGIPFLNGGLFDCLDKPDDSGKILYSDGYSRNPRKQSIVPDFLFFGHEQECDLNEIFGTRNKQYKVKGLVEILSSYKFTIAENTPLEEEVALDPELLGKVFENLLASYNPETQTTARKQTGSFYTPREIVDYMVDESLIAYFKSNLTPEKNLTPGPSPKERGEKTTHVGLSPKDKEEKSMRLPGYITTDPATYKVTKQFALENRQNATDAEAKLWEELRDHKIGKKFRRQHPIDKFIADFVCLEEKLVIEVDGSVHDTKERQEYDAMRTKRLVSLGYHELRFANEQILSDIATVLKTISSFFSGSPSPLERGQGGEVSSQVGQGGEVESRLRDLLSYSDNPNPFSPEETDSLILAIDACKILDPACGSGAFPMGILHKLVLVLHKLDPKNERWKKRQIQKAKQIDDADIREKSVDDIEEAFQNNELDYGRKLYLIENCIYGVDIQPIAVQIAKLRFFISLVIDQNKKPEKENLGVRSLPNLETKFVAADSLIALERHYDEKGGETMFRNADAITQLEQELREIRHSYFSAKTRKEKLKYQRQDKEKREAIANELAVMRFSEDDIVKLTNYDPYDQSHGASFFDSEWMFGLRQPDKSNGDFDIVIGNPPYVQIQNFSGMQQQKDWERQKFQTYVKTGDV